MRVVRRATPTALVDVIEPEEYNLPAITPAERSFVAVYELLFPPLTDFAARYLGRGDAPDAVQEAMFDIWMRWPVVAIDRPGASFFFRAVRNQVALAQRRATREAARLADYLYRSAPPRITSPADADLEHAELALVIESTVAAMPQRCREVWALVREHDLTYDQAAESLEISPVSVRRHMMRAQSLLRTALTDAGYRDAALRSPKTLHALPPASAAEEERHD
jgi:RNA polymerase sigma-70 factor (ECF subfamily)